MDWKKFGGGRGRFQINQFIQGTWEVDPLSPYLLSPPADAALYGRLPAIRVYPNEALAVKSVNPYVMRIGWGKQQNADEFGDQLFWSHGGMLVRTGRWHIDYTNRFPSAKREVFLPSVKRIRQFIKDSQLDTTLPVLPDP
jgi:hypothetical protein